MWYEDWRQASPEDVAPLLANERERWLTGLSWDIGPGLAAVERGRRSGRVPGVLARTPDGGCAGWTFFSVDRGVLSLGILVGERADVVRELLDRVLDAPEAAFARRYQGFLYPGSSAVPVALTRRRFALAGQRFLAWDCRARVPLAGDLGRTWDDEDLPNTVRLLARAYAGTPTAQAFAPEGRLEEWVGYLAQVTRAGACGVFLPQASIVVPGDRPDRWNAAILVTSTTAGVWHIAQVAVDPGLRRSGLGRRLVTQVCRAAAAAGAREVTLVVDERNEAARALYASLGFEDRAELLFGARPRLTRARTTDAETAGAHA
jgi:ribosomal protein S18 acetylase RimI-like enzyme